MSHPEIENRTGFTFEPIFHNDEEGRPILVPVIKATYALGSSRQLELAEDQAPLNVAGEHWGKPGESSYKYEPEASWPKPATDVALIAHAAAGRGKAGAVDVALQIGPIRKVVRVFGKRVWARSFGFPKISKPEPFDRIPLIWENAFGGWDRSHDDPKRHDCEARNPVGIGFLAKKSTVADGAPLPNLEDPGKLIKKPTDRPLPAGFGFVGPEWMPRRELAGTYDEAWENSRAPLLPRDFDRRFLNAAAPDLVAPGFLRGGEAVKLENVRRSGNVVFDLPSSPPPICTAVIGDADETTIETRLDTVIINLDEDRVFLLWRGECALREGPLDVASIVVDQTDGTRRE